MVGQFKDDQIQKIVGEAYGNGSVTGGPFETFNGVFDGAGSYSNIPNPTKTGYTGFSGIKIDSSKTVRSGNTTRNKSKGVKFIVKVL